MGDFGYEASAFRMAQSQEVLAERVVEQVGVTAPLGLVAISFVISTMQPSVICRLVQAAWSVAKPWTNAGKKACSVSVSWRFDAFIKGSFCRERRSSKILN